MWTESSLLGILWVDMEHGKLIVLYTKIIVSYTKIIKKYKKLLKYIFFVHCTVYNIRKQY